MLEDRTRSSSAARSSRRYLLGVREERGQSTREKSDGALHWEGCAQRASGKRLSHGPSLREAS